ncbi:MAG: hypothetical protein JW724_07265 [Candidatus Altiarchaeota archaeon]|nr:hypothetical protein [Candidatus Altiarchaeota archaeon]
MTGSGDLLSGIGYVNASKRLEYMTIRKLKDVSGMEEAAKAQDRIRRITRSRKSDLTGEIRKWRDRDAPCP